LGRVLLRQRRLRQLTDQSTPTHDQRTRRTMMKQRIPAVFFQKKVNGSTAPSQRPARLEWFQSEFVAVTSGRMMRDDTIDTWCDPGWAGVLMVDDSERNRRWSTLAPRRIARPRT